MDEYFINKIARKITGFKEDIITSVDEVLILVTNEDLNLDVSKYASLPRISKWSLNEIKELVSMKTPRYEFLPRTDGKNDPSKIGLTVEECLTVISQLNESDYDANLSSQFPDTNVYIKNNVFDKKNNKTINLYIKLSIFKKNKNRNVLIISFHPKEI